MFASLDSRGTGEQEGQRENALKQEFMSLVPAANRLKASSLVLQRHHSALGCRLEFFLWQRPQYEFDFAGAGEPPPAGANEAMAFEDDVRRVQAECKDVKTRLTLAQSPTLGHQDLANSTPAALDRIALRQLLRRKEHTVVLPTLDGGLDLDLPAAPRYLATGLRCELSATATKLTPDYMAHLRDLSLASSPEADEGRQVFLPASATACRKQLSHADQANLLVAMDGGHVVNLTVELRFEWATGAVSSISVHSIAGTP